MTDSPFNIQGPPELVRCKPGTVLAVRTSGFAGTWIRIGAALRGIPNLDNHIVVVHHVDSNGIVWGLEGKPGGVGWVNCANYFAGANGKYVVSNWRQPLTPSQRTNICAVTATMLKTPYDWTAIEQDAIDDLHLPELWGEKWNGQTPGHVVCSSLAAWAYHDVVAAGPYDDAFTGVKGGVLGRLPHIQPGDWTKWAIEKNYN